jgi:prevent-host-death family protein
METVPKFVQISITPALGTSGGVGAGQPSPAGRWIGLGEPSSGAAGERRRLHAMFRALAREPRRVPVAEFRTNLADVLAWSAESQRPVVLTAHGRPQAVLLSPGLFERVLKSLAREVLGLRSRRSHLAVQAEDVLAEEASAVTARLRGRAPRE